MKTTLPSLFLGHGSPMNLVLDNDFTQGLEELSQSLPLPKAIVMISAHWYTTSTAVSIASGISYETIYDFYGFPPSLYEIAYPSPSNNTISKKVADLTGAVMVERGLDHGAWMPLHLLFPKASIPVIQLSINKNLSMQEHVELGKKLASLRDEGIMLMGSGNLTHNLNLVNFYNMSAPAVEWAVAVDRYIEEAFLNNDLEKLTRIESLCPEFKIAHPSYDHYLPLLYIAATRQSEDTINVLTPFFQNASLSMKGFMLS